MTTLSKLITISIVILLVQLTSATAYSQDGSDLIKTFKRFKGEPRDSVQISICNKLAEKYLFNNTDSSLLFGTIALQYAKEVCLLKETVRAYNNIAKIYYVNGSFFESLSYADSASVISKQQGWKSELAIAINTRGVIYLGQKRFKEAIPEFKKALAINEQIKDSAKISANYFNIGLCHDELHQFKDAFANLKKALLIAEQCKDGHLNQMSLNRIGETYFHSRNYKQALFYYQSALHFTAYQDRWEKGFAYSGLAQTLYEMKRYNEALAYADRSFALMQQMKADWDTERAANILSKCYAALKDYQKAYEYQAIARAYGDSILNQNKEQEINYLHLQDQKAENLDLTRENENSRQVIKNNRIIISLTALFSILLLGALFLLRLNISRKNVLNRKLQESNDAIGQQKQEIQAQREALISLNQTKDRVLSVIGHDLRSPFASIVQALDMITQGYLDEQERKYILQDFHRQILHVSELIDNLLNWASSQRSGAQVKYEKINLTEVTGSVLSLYKPVSQQKKQHLIHQDQKPVYIEADENHVKIILQNIISNAIKFTPPTGTINLFYSCQDDFSAIHIKDSGKGMSEEKLARLFKSSGVAISENGTNSEPGTGLGLVMIKQFIEENDGRIQVRSEKDQGSEFIVYFKSCQKSDLSL
ncbi:tetratricopeptide repeat protein [Dyadobacter subterraneus]|uniref:histidine kinase n=1 Tax=Dyadobacter subterraneus TaxID=2773304 RepID=A0ABR9W9P6_9BACT|nr:tetratricopeptide repeat protein [Dyadobacter subterraneus]MBE9462207.1 tetratricopeptide repeat-containing sensor histidine kinase [Dyadobacter subterraneus]